MPSSAHPSGFAPGPFGHYDLVERIAVGGMAEVFLAVKHGEARVHPYVVKRILPGLASEEEFIRMFLDEASIAGRLRHPNIVAVKEVGRVGSSHYMTMDYISGRNLLEIVNRCRATRQITDPSMAAWVGAEICDALDYAHNKKDQDGSPLNIIHRDVSLQNIVVGFDGSVKLIDFGIARASERLTQTQAGILKGKFGYMSPEQAAGKDIDNRSDVFAVGICLWEMLTRSRLFRGNSDEATIEMVLTKPIPPIAEMAAHVPPDLSAIVYKALHRDREQRYQSAAELQAALSHFLAANHLNFTPMQLARWMEGAFKEEHRIETERLAALTSVMASDAPPIPEKEPTELFFTAENLADEDVEALTETSLRTQIRHKWSLVVASAVVLALCVGAIFGVLFLQGSSDLVVRTVPSNAKVSIDGVYRGRSEVTIEGLSPGTHDIEISHEGFSTHHRRVVLHNGEAHSFEVELLSNAQPSE